MRIVDTGITIIDEKVDNTDVSYNQPDNLSIMNPIPNNSNNRRYVPLLSFMANRNSDGVQEDRRYDGNGYVNIYYQMNTLNQSFLDMHYYLKAKGIPRMSEKLLVLYKRSS